MHTNFLRPICAAAVFAGVVAGARADLVDGITAICHDSIITHQQVEEYAATAAREVSRQYRTQPAVLEKELTKIWEESVERLLSDELILREFETAGYAIPETIIDEELEQYIKHQTPYGDRVTLVRSLQSEGKTYEQYRKRFRNNLIIREMRHKNIASSVIISPYKVEQYYLQRTNDFKVDEQIKLRMIILSKSAEEPEQARKLADEILSKITDRASFIEMASVYSQGAQRYQGQEWLDRTVLRKELADVAFELKPGERSGVVDTPEACYIMFVEDRRAAHIRPLNDVRDDIEATLITQEQERLQKQWISRLKKKTFVRYFE